MASQEFESLFKTLVANAPSDQSIEEIRACFEERIKEFPPSDETVFKPFELAGVDVVETIAPTSSNEHFALFFHGGGFNAGSAISHGDLMGRIADGAHLRVIGVDYRLAPEDPFPAAIEDGITTYIQLLRKGIDPQKIFLIGCSAGGGLVISLLRSLVRSQTTLPRAAAVISPWVDMTLTSPSIKENEGKDILTRKQLEFCRNLYLQDKDPKNPLASPILGELTGFPPLLIHVGGHELLLDDAKKLAEKVQSDSLVLKVFEGMVHVWHVFARKIPEGKDAINKLNMWLNKHRD